MKHGGDLTEAIARHGGTPDTWLDLSTGINPWVWPVPENLPKDTWQRLPSRADGDALIAAARAAYGVPDGAEIVAIAGTQMAIQWLPYLAASGGVTIVGPTYGEHELAWRNAGHEVIPIDRLDGFPENAVHAVIVNPNNPDGRIVEPAVLAQLAARLKDRGGWLIVDEAFADVEPAIGAAPLCVDWPVMVLRSFGKFYGLAGVRLGFAIGRSDIARRLAGAIGPWPCSGPALHIGTAALHDRAWADRMRGELRNQAGRLDAILEQAGFGIAGGTSLFRLARHPDALRRHTALARQHIWCRRFEWAGDLLRFGLPPDEAGLERLAAALASDD
jgi:cobalamin biosynthetic protein CobC